MSLFFTVLFLAIVVLVTVGALAYWVDQDVERHDGLKGR